MRVTNENEIYILREKYRLYKVLVSEYAELADSIEKELREKYNVGTS